MVVVHSFDGLVAKADKLANKTLHLHVFALKETTKPDDIAKNYYLEEDYFVIHSLKDKLSAQFIRLEVTEMIKNSEELYEEKSFCVRTKNSSNHWTFSEWPSLNPKSPKLS